ncbi:MAG: hypothetical protein AAGM40_09440, partial [Cyanobacteria bacterium J06573_2]
LKVIKPSADVGLRYIKNGIYIALIDIRKNIIALETSPLTPLLIKERGNKQTVPQLLDKRYI